MTQNLRNLNSAVRLYEILGKYIPETHEENALDYLNIIFDHIKADNNYRAYFEAIQLMTGEDYESITKRSPKDVLELFIKSLIDWHIIELVSFFRNVGYTL